jgi:hypothetical protein
LLIAGAGARGLVRRFDGFARRPVVTTGGESEREGQPSEEHD